jgi:hypothetical protein
MAARMWLPRKTFNGNGVYTIQAANLLSGGNYTLHVSTEDSTTGPGNLDLDTVFGKTAADLSTFASGGLAASAAQQSYNSRLWHRSNADVINLNRDATGQRGESPVIR